MAHKVPYAFHSHHSLRAAMGETLDAATPTQPSDQTQLHVPFISSGPAWWLWLQCKSLVPVNNLFSDLSEGSPLSLDIRLAERWMGDWGKRQSVVVGARKPEAIYLANDLWSHFIIDYNAPQHHTWAVFIFCSGSVWRLLFSLRFYLLFFIKPTLNHVSMTVTFNKDNQDKQQCQGCWTHLAKSNNVTINTTTPKKIKETDNN